MFTSSIAFTTAPVSQLVRFNNIKFQSTDTTSHVLDNAKFLRIDFTRCDFIGVKLLYAPTVYLQSLTLNICNIRRWSGIFFDSRLVNFGVKFDHCLVEAGDKFINVNYPDGMTVSNCTIEGMTGYAIRYTDSHAFNITNNFFEVNSLDIDGSNSTTSQGITISGNNFTHFPTNVYSVKWGANISGSVAQGNWSNGSLHSFLSKPELIIKDYADISVSNFTGSPVFQGSLTATTDVGSSGGQGRFGGWYKGDTYTGPAAELGYTGGAAYFEGYDRGTTSFIPTILQGSTLLVSPKATTTASSGFSLTPATITNASGQFNSWAIADTYNQSGSASSADIFINRTNTALGSGVHNFIQGISDGVDVFHVDRGGNIFANIINGVGSGLTSVPNSALVQMPANTIKGNNTGSTANAADLTAAQIKTLLGYYTSGSSPTFGTVTATSIVGALTGNSSTATSLQTARTIWGQSFNGSSNISGALSGVTGLTINGGAYSTTLTDVTAGGYTRQIFADGGVNKYLIGYNQTGSDTKFGFFDYASGTWSMTLYGGKVLINSTTPTTGNEQLQINGTASVSNLPNATGDFVTATSTGVLNRRTYAQALSDIGAQAAVTLTTIGTTAAATLIGGTLNIPQYATSNLLTSFYTDVASTTSAADAYSYTLAANSLTTNGQYLDCVYTASQTGGAVNTIIITFGGQTVYNNSANNLLTGTDPIGFKILRSGTTTARCQIYYLTTSGSVAYSTQDLTGVDFTTTNIIKASISSATAGTLTMKSGTITIYK
jgi:fibronectin-binding autotransporter adhesin